MTTVLSKPESLKPKLYIVFVRLSVHGLPVQLKSEIR
jgi:hypothetical protein